MELEKVNETFEVKQIRTFFPGGLEDIEKAYAHLRIITSSRADGFTKDASKVFYKPLEFKYQFS